VADALVEVSCIRNERVEVVRGSLRAEDLGFEVLDARRTLPQLGDQIRNIIGERHGLREPLLFRTHAAQLYDDLAGRDR
jgi:hypothetical protein